MGAIGNTCGASITSFFKRERRGLNVTHRGLCGQVNVSFRTSIWSTAAPSKLGGAGGFVPACRSQDKPRHHEAFEILREGWLGLKIDSNDDVQSRF